MSPERARKILNLRPDDGLETARRAFRDRVKRLHPDRTGGQRRAAYEAVVAAWRTLETEARPRAEMHERPAPVEVVVGLSWITVKMGETIEVEAPHRKIRVPLPTDAQPGDRLRVRGQGAEPDVIVTLHMAAKPTFTDALRRFIHDFHKPGAAA